MDINTLEEILRKSWNSETSYDPDNWSKDNPAWGQCAVTAMIVQDYFGGEIVWARAEFPNGFGTSHYFNKINGKEYDLTKDQFPEGSVIPKGRQRAKNCSTREYILSFPTSLKQRYELLKQRVEKNL